DVLAGYGPTAVARTDQKSAAVTSPRLDALDQLVNAVGLEDRVIVGDVALVVHFNQDVLVTAVEDPVGRAIDGSDDGGFVLQPLVLAEVKEAEDDGHPQPVGAVEDAGEPVEVSGTEVALGGDGRVVPGLPALRVALRAAALQVDGEGEQAVV